MSDFTAVRGFEDLWRPVARSKRVPDRGVLRTPGAPGLDARARLSRLASRAPEVMVKITGRTRDGGHLQAHLKYISRQGALPLEGRDGERLADLRDVEELAADWGAEDLRKRQTASLSVSIVLSMPAGTNILRTRDAARAFAQEVFGEHFDYVFALHTDAGHPHVHLAVRTLGQDGARLNARKADLEHWRQRFAHKLRERGVAAEATPRRSRGVVRKAERIAIRKLRERHEGGRGPAPRVIRAAVDEARGIVAGDQVDRPWERAILKRQQAVRDGYLRAAEALARSTDPLDQALSRDLRCFVAGMAPPATRRNELVRAIKELMGSRQARHASAQRREQDEQKSPRRR